MDNPLRQLSPAALRQRTSVKWRHYPPDVLPLFIAEMDVPLAEPIVEAVSRALAIGDTGYPAGTAYPEALAEFAAARWGWHVDVARTCVVADVMQGIVEVLRLVTGPGDAVVVNPPVYPPFYAFLDYAGRTVVEAPLSAAHRLDLDALDAAFTAATSSGRAAAFLLCSPHNPTGTVHTVDELRAVADLAARHRVRVVADEIHAPLTYPDATHRPYLDLPGTEDAFALLSASKAWNLAGVKAAVAVAGRRAAEELAGVPEPVRRGASHLGILAHVAALRAGSGWLDGLLGGLAGNRALLADLLAEHLPAVRYRVPQGTYLAWLDCRGLDLSVEPADLFLQAGKVALVPGPSFGTGGAGRVRLNFAAAPEVLGEAVRRMARALEAG